MWYCRVPWDECEMSILPLILRASCAAHLCLCLSYFFLFLTFWSLMYLYVLCFYRMCSTFNIMFSIKFYNIKHRAFCMCSTSIVFVKQWEAIIWLSCAGLCVFSWSRGTCKKKIRRMLAHPKAHEGGCIDWILKLYCKHTKRNIKQVRNAQAKMSSTRSSKYQGQNGHLTFISWHFAAPHQHRDTFGQKTWVQGPYWPFWKFEDELDLL